MSERTATTLATPRRCPWCGHRCQGKVCQYCADLARIEAAAMRDNDPAKARFRATCPNPKCGEIAKPGRKRCALCRTALYPADSFLAALTQPAKASP